MAIVVPKTNKELTQGKQAGQALAQGKTTAQANAEKTHSKHVSVIEITSKGTRQTPDYIVTSDINFISKDGMPVKYVAGHIFNSVLNKLELEKISLCGHSSSLRPWKSGQHVHDCPNCTCLPK